MRFKVIFFLLAVASINNLGAQPGQADYTKTRGGLWYKFHRDVDGALPKPGDYMKMHLVNLTATDSVVFSTYEAVVDPISYKLSAPAYGGDLAEGLLMLTGGDSATFYVPADSIYKGRYRPDYIKPGD